MTEFAIIIAFVLLLTGLIGAVVPGLPGPPLGLIGLVILYYIGQDITLLTLIIWGGIVLLVSLLDYFLGPYVARKAGGSRAAVVGSVVCVLLSLVVLPISLFLAAFLGAFIGELIYDSSDPAKALRVGFFSFLGFVVGTVMKVILSVAMISVAIMSLI